MLPQKLKNYIEILVGPVLFKLTKQSQYSLDQYFKNCLAYLLLMLFLSSLDNLL